MVSRDSGDLTVIDLDRLEIIGRVATAGVADHMAELSPDLERIYVSSEGTDETIVVDATRLAVERRIHTGSRPTHLSMSADGGLLAVMDEGDDAVSFIDPRRELEVKRLPGFATPHFLRYAPDGHHGWVANLGADHLTRVDLETLTIDGQVALAGHDRGPDPTAGSDDGFADAQIDADGVLYAAHAAAGRVLVYDTIAGAPLGELAVGARPWIVFAQHPFPEIRARVVPNLGDQTVSTIRGGSRAVATSAGADRESYGVNYSPLVPDRAFVMNRDRHEIAVIDTDDGGLLARIPLDGNTETASTTPDGRWIVAAVSSANEVVVIDATTNRVVKTFDGVGAYPWSVTIPGGQNYCH